MKIDAKKVADLIDRIAVSKQAIAAERDKLRDAWLEADAILESCDRGIEGIEEGADLIQRGIDSLSELL